MEALNRHFNIVLEEVMETWTELFQMGKPRAKTEQLDNDRFTSEMSTKGDSVILTIRLKPEKREIDTVNKVTGSKDIMRMMDGWRERQHPFCHESTHFRDPRDAMITKVVRNK